MYDSNKELFGCDLNGEIDFDEAIEKELTRYRKICEFVSEHIDDEDDDWDEDESIYW